MTLTLRECIGTGRWVTAVAASSLCLALTGGPACRRTPTGQTPPASPPSAPAAPTAPPKVVVGPPPADDEGALVEEAPERDPHSETVTIKLFAEPARKAHVYWGRKDLGLAPLEITRPRNTGPLDLVVVTPGALTLHTRVFTDRDDRLSLHLYGESDGPTMLGYRPPDALAETPAKHPGAPRAARPRTPAARPELPGPPSP